jgi:hypothetical protein
MAVLIRPSASELSPEWDGLADSYFQRRKFLLHSEAHNPCRQRYYEIREGGRMTAGACVYTLRLDLLTFARVKSPVRFAIVGIPASISSPGFVGEKDAVVRLLPAIFAAERGIVLLLNLPPDLPVRPAVGMRMMPTVLLRHDFKSWDEYRRALRASYRRRLGLIERAFEGVRREEGPCSALSREMYGLYLQVMARTMTKLETLSYDYFRNLPEEFRLTSYGLGDRVIAWHINLHEGDRLTFFFGGTDDAFLKNRRAYQNNIAGILREAFDRGFREVDFGQTAEIAKMRLGGGLVEKDMAVYSRNRLVRLLLRLGRHALEYRRRIPPAHVFVQRKDGPA